MQKNNSLIYLHELFFSWVFWNATITYLIWLHYIYAIQCFCFFSAVPLIELYIYIYIFFTVKQDKNAHSQHCCNICSNTSAYFSVCALPGSAWCNANFWQLPLAPLRLYFFISINRIRLLQERYNEKSNEERKRIWIETHPDLTCTPTWPQWQLWDCPSHSTMLWRYVCVLKCVYVCAWIQRKGDSMKVHHTHFIRPHKVQR